MVGNCHRDYSMGDHIHPHSNRSSCSHIAEYSLRGSTWWVGGTWVPEGDVIHGQCLLMCIHINIVHELAYLAHVSSTS